MKEKLKREMYSANSITKDDVEFFYFSLENFEHYTFYKDEIVDMHIELVPKPIPNKGKTYAFYSTKKEPVKFYRRVQKGYIKIAINEKHTKKRVADNCGISEDVLSRKDIIKRLVGICDIITLYFNLSNGYRDFIKVPYDENEKGLEEYYKKCKKCKEPICGSDVCELADRPELVNLEVCSSAELDEEGNLIVLMGELSKHTPGIVNHGEIHKCTYEE